MSDPLLFSLVQDLEFQTGYRIKQVVATRGDIIEAIQTGYPDKALMRVTHAEPRELAVRERAEAARAARRTGRRGCRRETALARRVEEEVFEPVAGLKERSEAAPIIDLVDLVVKSAIKSKASDIHVEPMEKGVLIRHRLDGLLKEVMDLPKWVHEGLIARLKIMAGMDIAEKRLPQDGRLRVDGRGRHRGRLPRLDAAHALRREGRHARARSPQGRAGARGDRHVGDGARGGARVPPPPARHDSRRRPDRQRQDDDAQLGADGGAVGEDQHHHDRGSGRVPDPRRQPDADQREDQADVRQRAALDPAAGSRRHPRRRDPRRGDGEDRDAGGADGPPRALDAAHRRCAVGA